MLRIVEAGRRGIQFEIAAAEFFDVDVLMAVTIFLPFGN